MVPTLIVLGLLALGVGIVAFATRRTPTRIDGQRMDNDTAWADPAAPAAAEADPADPFAHAPPLSSPAFAEQTEARAASVERT